MKKLAVPLFLAACLLLTACGKAPDEPAAPTAEPTAAADPTAAPETLTPKPTAEPTPEPTAAPRFAVGDETVYVLCEGRSDGAKALSRWLRSEGKDAAESFIPDGLDTPMYTIPAAERASEEIPAATDETRHVRVAADAQLLESGVLAAWLPAFEAASGYVAEVYAGDASVLFYHHGSVVLQACGPTLKERCHDYYPALLGYLTEHLCGWAGDRFGEVEVVNILFLTEVE